MNNGRHVNTSVKAYFFHTTFSRPPEDRRVVFHLNHHEINGTTWSISFPVQLVMNDFPQLKGGHFGYCHGISLIDANGKYLDQQNYIGITKRSWLRRMSEHFREVQSGSNKVFHRAWRQYAGSSNVHLSSELIVANYTFDEIMGWEEWAVDKQMVAGTSLNMIPGGFKGTKFLHKHRVTKAPCVALRERNEAVKRFQSSRPRVGMPNLLVSNLWTDPKYAENVICGVRSRLSTDQVRRIRELNSVLKGVTYSRIG
jgi:hypothetical protein